MEDTIIVTAPPTTIKPEEAPAVVAPAVAPVVPPVANAPASPIATANNANYENLIKGIKGLHINKRVPDENKAGRENIIESKMKHLNKSVKKEHIAKWRKNQMREAAKKRFARTIKTARNKTVAAKRLKSAKFGQSAFRPRPTMHIAAEPNNMANMFNQMEIEEL
jgi:Cu/Zn superoxide dismutase